MYQKILSVGAIILGVYIIIHFLFLNPGKYGYFSLGPDPTYHIGCYDVSFRKNISKEISEELFMIEETIKLSAQLNLYDLKDQKAMSPYFQKDVYEVAKSFEKYLDQYNHQKIKSEQDLHYYSSLKNAKIRFNMCKSQVLQKMNETDCLNSWERFLYGAHEFEKLKSQLMQKIRSKEKQEKRISDYLSGFENTDVEDLEMAFETKMKDLNKKQQETQDLLVKARIKKQRIDAKVKIIEDDVTALKALLKDCQDNAKVIHYCQQINEQLKSLKQTNSEQALKQRAALKRKIIQAQLYAIRKARKIGNKQQILEAESNVNKINAELKEIQRQIEQLNAYQESRCSQCSQEKMNELRKNITDLQNERYQDVKEQTRLSEEIITFDKEIKEASKAKHSAEQQFQKDKMIGGMKACIDQDCEKEQQKFINSHKDTVTQLKDQISLLNANFFDQRVKNRKNIEQMNKFVAKIQEINSCLNKKDYYDKLLTLAPKKTDEGQRKIENAKLILIRQLSDFDLVLPSDKIAECEKQNKGCGGIEMEENV